MPRRGKKTSLSLKKPRLHFTESPVQVENNPVSPVLGAENPVTAKSVQLEDYSDISWISPNFKELRNRYQVSGCRRNLRQRKARTSTTQQHTSSTTRLRTLDKENNSIAGKTTQNKRCKFKPLMFLQDELDEELESELNSISVQNSSTLAKGNSFLDNVSIHTPVLNATGIQRHSDLSITVGCNVDHLPCLCSSPTTRHSLAQKNNPTSCPVHQQVNNRTPKRNTSSQLNNSPLTRKTSSIRNHQHSRLLGTMSDVSLNSSHLDECDSPKTRNLRRSSRLREKYLEAVKLFQCSSPKGSGRVLKVLAEDTPESEYHLRMKRRQLRNQVAPL